MKNIRNIIFDFGGVLLHIDYQLTEQSFILIGIKNFADLYSQLQQNHLFDDYETGHIATETFIKRIQELQPSLTDAAIIDAWNAMLLDLPKWKIDWIQTLRSQYNIYLYSNTNALHEEAFLLEVNKVLGSSSLDPYFDEVFYSHKIGYRKPHKEGFQHILNKHGLQADQTLFIDDSPQHIEGATNIGLQTLYLPKGKDLKTELSSLLNLL